MFSVGDRVTTPAGTGVIASTRALGLHGILDPAHGALACDERVLRLG